MVAVYLPSASWISGSYDQPSRKDALIAMDRPGALRLEETSLKTLSRIRPQQKAEIASRTVTALSLSDLSITFVRNVLRLIIGPNHAVIRDLSISSSAIGIVLGSSVTVGNGIANLHKAQAIGDVEGVRRASSRILSGSISTVAAALSFSDIFASSIGSLGMATTVFCGLGSIVNLGISGWGIFICAHFRSRISGYLEMKHLSEKERIVKALEFLKGKIAPTEKEKKAIARQVESLHPNWTKQQVEKAIQRKILNLGEMKIRRIKRRTDQKTAERILLEVGKHLERLQDKAAPEKHLVEAKGLISQIMKQNMRKIELTLIVGISSTLAFSALILSTFFSLGILPLALYMLSSAIGLGILLIPLMIDSLSRSKDKALESRRALALTPVTVVTTNINSG